MLPLKALGKNSPLPHSSFWCLLAILSIPWLIAALPESLPLSVHGILPCVYSHLPFLQGYPSVDLGPTVISMIPILTN